MGKGKGKGGYEGKMKGNKVLELKKIKWGKEKGWG